MKNTNANSPPTVIIPVYNYSGLSFVSQAKTKRWNAVVTLSEDASQDKVNFE